MPEPTAQPLALERDLLMFEVMCPPCSTGVSDWASARGAAESPRASSTASSELPARDRLRGEAAGLRPLGWQSLAAVLWPTCAAGMLRQHPHGARLGTPWAVTVKHFQHRIISECCYIGSCSRWQTKPARMRL